MKNNKGFSLVELIIVIAIMAILVGVMAPQLIKYIEKTNVSADTQLADSVKTAITTTIMDPAVINKNPTQVATVTGNTSWTDVSQANLGGGSATDAATVYGGVSEILGFEASNASLVAKLKSHHDTGAKFQYKAVNGNTVAVQITTTDITGKKGNNASNYIVVGE